MSFAYLKFFWFSFEPNLIYIFEMQSFCNDMCSEMCITYKWTCIACDEKMKILNDIACKLNWIKLNISQIPLNSIEFEAKGIENLLVTMMLGGKKKPPHLGLRSLWNNHFEDSATDPCFHNLTILAMNSLELQNPKNL